MPSNNKFHPTQKPFELVRDLIADCTEEKDVVLDPFAGSGTTLLACEALGRHCVAAEIDPHHVDTIRRRWAVQMHGEDCDWESLTPALVAA
jgi:DNA modification methylase